MTQRKVLEQEQGPIVGAPLEIEMDRDAIRAQLERILAHPLFKHSKRYPLLFRTVVERTLEGHSSQLKERTLGVEVFARHPDYDTSTDPVVRVTAGEIRKRIAQYYHEPGHESELRIDIPSGSYVPEFHRPLLPLAQPPVQARPATALAIPAPLTARTPGVRWAAVAVLPILAGLAFWFFYQTSLDRFWGPFWESRDAVLLCVGGHGFAPDLPPPNEDAVTVNDEIQREFVGFADATTLSRLAELFRVNGKTHSIRIASATTFADLQSGPVVLVGAYNNNWTMRLLGQLRFSFARDKAKRVRWIEDREHPSNHAWVVDSSTPNLQLSDDYAIISRVLDPATDRMVVVVAGIAQYGTTAAGEFLTNPKYMEQLVRQAPSNWQHKNLEAVIATKVVHGNSGPPRVLASYFW